MMVILIVSVGFNMALGQEQNTQNAKSDAVQNPDVIQLPPKNSPAYWNVRTEAISELLPLLTKKRSETKRNQQLFKDYLLNIDKASDFAASNVPVPSDPNVYFAILQVGQGLADMNIPKPKKRPSWDEIMDVAMRHVVFEGYSPTYVEEGEDLAQFVNICNKKEEYGQKVRQDLRGSLDQCARMWVYLESIGKLGDFKAYFADLQSAQKAQIAQEKAQVTEQHRQAVMQRQAQAEQQKFEDAQAREQFHSSRREQTFDSRQSRLNSRAANAGINVFY